MAYPLWPAHVGQYPERGSIDYAILNDDEVFAVEDGEGFDLVGPKTGAEVISYGGTWAIDLHLYPAWKAWWTAKTGSGRLPFWLPDPLTLSPRLWTRKPGERETPVKVFPTIVQVRLTLRSVPHA